MGVHVLSHFLAHSQDIRQETHQSDSSCCRVRRRLSQMASQRGVKSVQTRCDAGSMPLVQTLLFAHDIVQHVGDLVDYDVGVGVIDHSYSLGQGGNLPLSRVDTNLDIGLHSKRHSLQVLVLFSEVLHCKVNLLLDTLRENTRFGDQHWGKQLVQGR